MQDKSAIETEEAPRDPMSSLVGETLSGRYRIEEQLGAGGMGAVFRAEHTLMRKQLAIKVLHPEMTRHPEIVERFEREAMAAAHIDHPNVAAATDFGKLEDGSFFLVLEYVEGESLRDALQDGPFDPRRVVHIGKQIVAALVRAHGLGIIHRDLKPENVMLVQREEVPDFVKVLDFGIAKVPVGEISKEAGKKHKTLTKAGMVYGTPEYMAPEQALGQDVDARADLYALGVIVYEMLVGRRPFEADSPVALLGMQISQTPPSFAVVAPTLSIPIELETLVMELLEKEASQRPSDAIQVREAFGFLERLCGEFSGEEPGVQAERCHATDAPTLFEGLPHKRLDAGMAQRVSDLWHRLSKPIKTLSLTGMVGMVGAGVALMVLVGGFVFWWFASPSEASLAFDENWPPPATSAAVEAVSANASPEELENAKKSGSEALEKLLDSYPNDLDVLESLALAHLSGSTPSAAFPLLDKLFLIEPEKKTDPTVIDALVKAASERASTVEVFDLLESRMGTQGPDILYDMVYARATKDPVVVARATKAIRSEGIRKMASPALSIALELRFTGGCQGKHRLLDRAKEEGDERSLGQLRGLLNNKGCGFLKLKDCWKCMRADRKLTDAIKAISERTKSESAASGCAGAHASSGSAPIDSQL
jgi:serine/threonine-protein kinase